MSNVFYVDNTTGPAATASRFGYDTLNPAGKRKSPPTRVVREDYHTRGNRHTALGANAGDLCRNLALAAWMVRRHLDYTSQFQFHGRNDSPIDDVIERLMREDASKERCDVARKFSREKMFRLAEASRVIGGDVGLIKLRSGKLQGIQADLIKNPDKIRPDHEWVNGVRIDKFGGAIEYAIHRRKSLTGKTHSKTVPAANFIHYGFFERFANDQTRGVSPMVSALDPLRDVYENFNYALAKAKVSQLFALAFFRDADDSAGHTEEDDALGRSDSDEDHVEEANGYKVNFTDGPQLLDMEPGDRAEFLESRQPSSEFQDFTQLVIQVALKSLDIPFSFYDESHTNFFGSRAAWLHYERSAHDKREDQIEMRSDYTRWKLRGWIRSGRLVLPTNQTVNDVRFQWVPRGMPWWDPSKEIKGHVQAIGAGLDNPQRVCMATGTDLYDNIDQIAKAREYAESKGVPLEFAIKHSATEQEKPDE